MAPDDAVFKVLTGTGARPGSTDRVLTGTPSPFVDAVTFAAALAPPTRPWWKFW
jgi:hypothetical protein